MATNTRRPLTVDDVLAEIFENSDYSEGSDVDSDNDDNDFQQIVQDFVPNIAQRREIPIQQAPNPMNRDLPVDVAYGWSSTDNDPTNMPFTGASGLTEQLPDSPTAFDFFDILFDEGMWDILTAQTNLYAEQSLATMTLKPQSRMQKWSAVTIDEMKVFFALVIAMGLSRKSDINAYWSTQECNQTPFFGSRMTKDRFLLILSNLHVADNSTAIPRGEAGHDALYKLRPFETMMKENFMKYKPDQDLSFDEGLCPFKGRVHFRVYSPMKPNKFGVKLFQVCEAKSGYCVGFDIYHGTTDCIQNVESLETEDGSLYSDLTVTSKIVLGMLAQCGLLSKGHNIYMDNYYTSPELFTELDLLDTYACGTVRTNRCGVPKVFGEVKKLKHGETVFRRSGNLLAIKHHDKRDIHMLSTLHHANLATTNKNDRVTGLSIMKPQCIIDYVHNMGGVDLCDQIVQYYDILRKSVKWWKKVFFHLFNLVLVNGYILYKKYGINVRRKSHLDFRVELIKCLIASAPEAPKPKTPGRRSTMENLNRLTGRHFANHIQPKEGAKKMKPMRDCIVCNVPKGDRVGCKRKQTAFECQQCKKPMCMPVCFERYHTLRDYKLTEDQ